MKSIFLLIIITFFTPLSFLSAREETVVCIHGFLNTYRTMYSLKKVLRQDFCVYSWSYESRGKTLGESGAQLVVALQQIAQQRPGIPIYFATHSVGALVLRVALNDPACPQEAKIGKAVLIGPPNQGSGFARHFQDVWTIRMLVGDKTGREMMTYTPEDMECLGSFPPSMEVFVIAGSRGSHIWFTEPNDGFVTVRETMLLTPHFFATFPLTHGALLRNRHVKCLIRKFFLFGC